MRRSRDRRGVTMIIFILMIAVFAGYFMLRHMFSAVQKAKQSIKLFNATAAMNLAEAAIGCGVNACRDAINTPNDDLNGFYMLFRFPVEKLRGRAVDLSKLPAVPELEKTFNGKIEKLEARFAAVAPIVDKTGKPVSLDNVEKCGGLVIECHARFADSLVRVETRQDFKVAILREPRLHHYALAVRDAWGEYSSKPVAKYWSTGYTTKPGSWEGYNPADHHLVVTSPSNGYSGKILLNGPQDPDKKIVLDLCDDDTDLMKPLVNRKKKHDVRPDEWGWQYSAGEKNLTKADAEKLWGATFNRDDFAKDPFGPDYKSSVYFSKKNLGYRSKYKFLKRDGTWSSEKDSLFFPTEGMTQNPDQWKTLSFLFGAPTFFYESAQAALAGQFGLDSDLWTHHRDRADRGLDLWGAPGARTPCPVEGNVFARYTSLAYLLWHIEPEGHKYDLYAPFPGGVDLMPSPADPGDPRNVADFQIYEALRTRVDEEMKNNATPGAPKPVVFSPGATKLRAEGLKDDHNVPINYDTEVHALPWNALLYGLKVNEDAYKDFPDFVAMAGAANATLAPAVDFEAAIANYMVMNKFTAIYDDEEEFFADRVTTDVAGKRTLHLDGKMLVVGDLHLDRGPLQYRGAGTIVVFTRDPRRSANLYLGSHLAKSPDAGAEDTFLTLVATFGKILVTGDNLRIEAALFALSPGYKQGDVDTQSFLIGPNKEIQQAKRLEIVGSLCADRLNLPTLPTTVDLTYDPNLAPALDDAERHRDYHVSVSKKFSYWYRGAI